MRKFREGRGRQGRGEGGGEKEEGRFLVCFVPLLRFVFFVAGGFFSPLAVETG